MCKIIYTFTTSCIYCTKIIYKTMVTEMLVSCVNTSHLILQEVQNFWNVRYNGNCSTQGARRWSWTACWIWNDASSISYPCYNSLEIMEILNYYASNCNTGWSSSVTLGEITTTCCGQTTKWLKTVGFETLKQALSRNTNKISSVIEFIIPKFFNP